MQKCLVVDDDRGMLDMLAQCVTDLGYEPITAEDGDQAFSAFRQHHPVLVISDIHMPNRNGLLLLKDIKEDDPTVPIILITGWMHYKAALNTASPRPDALLEKPFALDQLRKTIADLRVESSAA
ncbi:MAG: response regulator [Calditrichaeota bacterium]|nr:response regulator [Calditrichota bacterium]MCB9391308.1 response regulator [Calditrichota bacterium]